MTTACRVLVVDDDNAVLMMLQEGLKRDDFEVVAASNVKDALKHIASEKFDVLLSDLHMPLPGDGFTVVSAMRPMKRCLRSFPRPMKFLRNRFELARSRNSFAPDYPALSSQNG
jgi:CheY-like chemotaxis protein